MGVFFGARRRASIARSLVTVLALTLLVTIAPSTLFPRLLPQSHAAGDGLNSYYRNDSTGGDDKDLSSPFTTLACVTEKLTSTTKDWSSGGPTNCSVDNFTGYYTGYILGPKTGTVNFTGSADDVLIVRINGTSVVKKYLSSGSVSGSFDFVAGVAYPIQIWFHEVGGTAAWTLNWDASGSAATIGSSYLGSTAANLLSSQYQTPACQIGSSAACPAFSPQEIYNLYGTVTDGNYWIMTGGSPSYQYVLMSRSIDSGGWILGMKANKTTTSFDFDDTYHWQTMSTENSTPLEDMSTFTPARISVSGTGSDGKYEAFNTIFASKIRAVFPQFAASTYGGRYTTNNNYGFMWEENLSSLTPGAASTSGSTIGSNNFPVSSYPYAASQNCSGITTITLNNLFSNSKRCTFGRTPAYSYTAGNSNTTSYDPIGNNLFASQNYFAWWGINYMQPVAGGSPAQYHHARFGFGWNENSPNTDEGSNDVTAGIGLVKAASGASAYPSGSYVGCCQSQTGQTGQMAFEIYLRQADPSLGAPTNLVATGLSSTSVNLTWNAPAGVSATEYVVQYKTNSASWDSNVSTLRILDPDSAPSATITGLTAGTAYAFRVFARTIDMTTNIYDTNSSATAAYVRYGHEDRNIDSAFSFAGNQNFISSAEAPFDIPTGTTFTLEAWVRPSSTSGSQIIAGKNGQYSLYISNGSYGFNFYPSDFTNGWGGDAGYFGSSSVRVNEWQHVAFTRSGTSYKFYLNGNLVSTATLTGSNAIKDGSANFSIGGYSSTDQPFSGQIDQVRLWSTERSLSEINDGMHRYIPSSTTGLVAAYGFNEGTGTTVYNILYDGTGSTDLTLNSGTSSWATVATTTVSAPYTYVTFTRSILNANGGWRTPDSITAVSAVIVGGGGGGNAQTDSTGWFGGGGGAGAYQFVTANVTGGRYETVTVGLGGRRGAKVASQVSSYQSATNGQDSKFLNRTSIGGGAGGGMSSVSAANAAGASGGSGGGGGTYSGTGGTGTSGQGNNGGSAPSLCCASGGGGGAGSSGGNGTSTGSSTGTGGAAGDGVLNPLYLAGTSAQYIAAGGAGGGFTTNGAAGSKGGTAFGTTASANTGSGGGAGGGGASSVDAGFGAAGIVILRYITAIKPSYTKPSNAYLNVGMTETFSTNIASDSATVGLTRTFRWESSTTGANGTFSLIKQGTGASNAFFSWIPTDTTTSGSNYVYRLIVTDSDTAGLYITDSSTAFAIINLALNVVARTNITKTVGISRTETFTVTRGTPSYTYLLAPDGPFFSLDTSTVGFPRLRIADTATIGTYYETLTVTDSVSASIVIPLTIVISPPPSFSASSPQVDSGTVLYLDAGNSVSYPFSGSSFNDISGRALSADLAWAAGTTAVNAVGTTRSTTSVLNNITCATPAYSSDGNGSLVWNGSSSCGYVRNLGFYSTYSYEVWIKRNDSQTVDAGIISNPNRVSGDQMNYLLKFITANSVSAGVYNGTTFYWTPGVFIATKVWTHLAVTYDGTTLTLFVNGVSSATVNPVVTWNPAIIDNGMLLGWKYNDSKVFNGSIGSLRFYSRALTSNEVQQNFSATATRFSGILNENVINQKYASRFVDTYTITSGSETVTTTFSGNAISGIKWDTSTARSLILTLQDTLTPGTYYDTITATDSYGSISRLPLTFNIAKADSITVYIETPTVLSFTGSPANVNPTLRVLGLTGLETGASATATVRYKPGGGSCATGGYCRVGDIGPGGGVVFIDTSTASSDGRIYEVAPYNWSGSDDLATVATYCSNSNSTIGATQIGIGWGETNTNLAKSACLGGAVALVNNFNQSNTTGYSDWFIPSTNEATELVKIAIPAGLVRVGSEWTTGLYGYWTSTEVSASTQRSIGGSGSSWNVSSAVLKSDASNNMVRPVRAFRPCWAIDTCTSFSSASLPALAGDYGIVTSGLTINRGSLNNYSAVIYQSTPLVINKVAPNTLTIPWINTNYPDTFTITIPSSSSKGALNFSTTNGTATGCTLDYRKIYTSTQGTCFVTITRQSDRNFLTDTTTATIFFLTFVLSQPSNQVGSGPGIAINGATALSVDTTTPPSISGLSTLTLSLGAGGTFTITGTGFSAGSLSVKFWRNKVVTPTGSTATTITFNVSDIASSGATTGRISVNTIAGQAISVDSLTITP